MLRVLVNYVRNPQSHSVRTLGISENVQTAYVERLDERFRLLEQLIRLAAHSGDKVNTDESVRHQAVYLVYLMGKQCGVVMAAHQFQHRVAARLERYVEMRHESFRLRRESDYPVGKQIRLYRRDAVTLDSLHAVQRLYEVVKSLVRAFTEITYVDAGNHYFLSAVGRHLPRLAYQVIYPAATASPAGTRDGAIAAIIVATVLHFQEISRAVAFRAGWYEFPYVLQRGDFHHLAFFRQPMLYEIGYLAFLVVSCHNVNAVDSSHLIAFQLGVAAGHGNHRIRIFRRYAAYFLTAFLVGKLGDGAGVDYANVGNLAFPGSTHTFFRQHLPDGRSLRKIQFASERMVLGSKISEY